MKERKLTPFGREVKKALINKGMTQVRLAESIGVSPKYINLIIYGDRSGKKYINDIIIMLDIEPNNITQSA